MNWVLSGSQRRGFVIAVMSTFMCLNTGVTNFTNSVFLLPRKYWKKKRMNEGNKKRENESVPK